MDTPKPEEPVNKKCLHSLLMNREDNTTVPYWDCIDCGAVAFFDPSKLGIYIPRPS